MNNNKFNTLNNHIQLTFLEQDHIEMNSNT